MPGWKSRIFYFQILKKEREKENAFGFKGQYTILDGKEKGGEKKKVSQEGEKHSVFRLSSRFHGSSPQINTQELSAYFLVF
jgi:hypothetical protein